MIEPSNMNADVTSGLTAVPQPASTDAQKLESKPRASNGANGDAMRERIHGWAGGLHRGIDYLEQTLSSKGEQAASGQSAYAEQARQYSDKLRGQITAQPFQAAGIALAAGVVLHMLLAKPKVRLVRIPVKVPVRTTVHFGGASAREHAGRWMHGAESAMERLRGAGQQAIGAAGTAAGLGVAGAKSLASSLTSTASTLPAQTRVATQRLLAKSQAYGSVARSGVETHPRAVAGAMFALGALLVLVPGLRQRQQSASTGYAAVGQNGSRLPWQDDQPSVQARVGHVVAARPLASAVVMLGVGALIGALMKRT